MLEKRRKEKKKENGLKSWI